MYSSTRSGTTTHSPSGLFSSLASFATNFNDDTPADAVNPSSSLTRSRSSWATHVALPIPFRSVVTSM